MFKYIIEASVRFRWFVVLVTALVSVWGLFQLTKLPIDAVPDITNRQVQINTVAPALAPEQMERQVTYPLETAMAGIPGLESTRSLTRNGFSQVTVIFTDRTDIYFARQQVAERMAQARENLPENIEPSLSPITTGLGEVLMWTVDFKPFNAKTAQAGRAGWQPDGSYLTPEGERLDTPQARATYLRTVQDWIIAPRMRNARGLAGVDVNGGYVKEYAVRPDPARLAGYGLGLGDLVQALDRANTQAGAGYVQRAGEALTVRTDALASTVDDLAQAPVVNRNGLVVRVADVATVEIGQAPRLGGASRDGHEAVIGTALMLAGENSRTVAQAAAKQLDEIAVSLPADVVAEPVLNRSALVNSTIKTVAKNLTEGALLVILVLFLLLGNIRAATITALMIPISFLFAVIGMNRFGISGNLMSLGALDFGLLVDGAVVVVENTLLQLGQKRADLGRMLTRRERLGVATDAARQMVRPAAFGQLIILLVFTPLLMLGGVEGKTFIPMGATVMLALVGAFIFSFTFVPAMTALMVREPKTIHLDEKGQAQEHETFLLRHARQWIEPTIRTAMARPKAVLMAAIGTLVVGALTFAMLGREFIPTLDEGDVAMQALRVPSASLEQSLEMQMALERVIKDQPEVKTVFSRTGTAEAAVDPMPPNISDAVIILKPRKEWPNPRLAKEDLIERFETVAATQLGNSFEFSQPIELRFNELISGVRTDLAVMVYGDDFAQLQATADQVANALRNTHGSADVRVEQASGLPTLTISVDRFAAANYGLSAADVSEAVSTAIGGTPAGQIFEGDRRFDVVVRLPDEERNNPAALDALPVTTPSGITIPLSSVARIQVTEGQNQISRNNGSRRMVVQANVRGRDLGGFVSDAQAKVDEQLQLPAGYSLTWGGQFENLKRAEQRLGLVVPVVFILIGILLFMALGSFAEAGVVFACVPLALVGGALALLLRGMPFSVSAAVGFIAVSGVATLNGLVLMQAIRERLQDGQSPHDAALSGAFSRLRAVLTTALVAIVGFIPMALAQGAGAEVQKPLATVVIGGLLTATVLTLLVLPTFAAKTVKYRRTGGSRTDAPIKQTHCKRSVAMSADHNHDHAHENTDNHAGHDHAHGGILGPNTELIFALGSGVALIAGFALEKLVPGLASWIPLAFFLCAYVLGGFFTVGEAVENLKKRRFEIDTLMLVAAAGAAALGHWAEGALLLFLFSLGHALEHYAMGRAKRAIEALGELAPRTARVRRGQDIIETPVEQLEIGDVVIVRPNERLPADGFIIAGTTSINQAPVTGESMPVDKHPVADPAEARSRHASVTSASVVFAGTINGAGAIEIETTRKSSDTTLAKVVRMVSEAETQKSPTQRFTDKFERIFVPLVLALTFVLLFAWVVVDEPFRDSFYRAMAVLVAASPCALAIATPSAVLSGVARAARAGVLIKGGAPLESLGAINAIAFDKTGTLTEGQPRITDVVPFTGIDTNELLRVAVAVERLSDHPLAEAIARDGTEQLGGVTVDTASSLHSLTGKGVTAQLDGQTVYIGKPEMFGADGVSPLDAPALQAIEQLRQLGRTLMVVRHGDRDLGVIGLLDTPRPAAREALDKLRSMGVQRMIMISGDHQKAAEAIAAQVGLTEAWGNLMPDHKVEAIKRLRADGNVAMVGDGVNDAPAMATATVGVAMGAAGSDVALETADVALMADDLSKLSFIVGLSRRTRSIILQNLFVSLGVVAFLVPATILGLGIGPAIALHEGSTLLVVFNALRLLAYRDRN